MATVSSTLQLTFFLSRPTNSSSSSSVRSTAYFSNLNSKFLGSPRTKTLGWCRLTTRLGPSSGSRTTCWFRFGKNGVDAEGAGIYGSQTRDDFDRDDVEQFQLFKGSGYSPLYDELLMDWKKFDDNNIGFKQYFNYMGMLAVEGTYDKMDALLNQNIHPVDILLMMAAAEGDKPKIEELLRAGADYAVKDSECRSALERAPSEEIKDFIRGFSVQKA